MLRGRRRNGCFPRRHDGQCLEGSLVPGRQAMRFQGAAKWKVAKKVKLNCPGWTWQILPWLQWWSLPPRLLLPLPAGAAARQSHWVSWGVVSRSTFPRVPGKTTGARDAVVSQCTWLAKVCLLMGCKAAGNLGQQHRISRNCIVTSSPRLEGNISDAQWPVVYAISMCAHQPFHINVCFTDHFSHTCTCSAVGCVPFATCATTPSVCTAHHCHARPANAPSTK